jgi:hypothetical protein
MACFASHAVERHDQRFDAVAVTRRRGSDSDAGMPNDGGTRDRVPPARRSL